jgi:hypothetical protein
MNIFIIKILNTFIRFHRFLKPNNINNIVYFDVSTHYIKNKFQKRNVDFFLWTF